MKDHRGADLNNGGPISTDFVGESWTYPDANYTERAKIVDAHKLYTQSFLWFMSTDPALNQSIRTAFQKFGLCKDEFTETDNWPPNLYVRAARRLLGAAVFNQNTPSLNRSWGNESIGCGSYNFDSHTAERIACPNATACRLGPAGDDDAPAAPVAAPVLLLLLYLLPLFMLLVLTPRPKGIALSTGYAWMEGDVETGPGVYDIPMWVLLPRASEATNLLVVASPSASHIGMSTLRMEVLLAALVLFLLVLVLFVLLPLVLLVLLLLVLTCALLAPIHDHGTERRRDRGAGYQDGAAAGQADP